MLQYQDLVPLFFLLYVQIFLLRILCGIFREKMNFDSHDECQTKYSVLKLSRYSIASSKKVLYNLLGSINI